MPLSIVLIHPQIPQNTGNIARLTAALGAELHLIQPMAFTISDSKLKRAGLDYWPEVKMSIHSSFQTFLDQTKADTSSIWLIETGGCRAYYEAEFSENDFILLGSETKGIPMELRDRYRDRLLTIPMANERVRSINLSSCAAIALSEAKRQLKLKKD